MPYQILSRDPQYYSDQIHSIAQKANALCVKPEDSFSERDVFVAVELYQRYIELLSEIQNTVEISGDDSIEVIVEGKAKLKLPCVEQIAEWINNGDQEP